MGGRRELGLAAGLCLAGAALLVLAGGRVWVTVPLPARPPLPASSRSLTGDQLVGGLSGLALLGLAGVAGLVAARGRLRQVVAGLLALAGLAAAGLAAQALRHPDLAGLSASGPVATSPWPYAAVLGGLLLAAAGVLGLARGHRWLALSARYEAPGSDRPEAGSGAPSWWEAQDRGEDPTR